ncbi:MAG: ATP-dependent RecD-like DNA helicase [Lachnospiraceae bacterium]
MTELEGQVERIVYRNEDNGYTVLVLDTDGGDESVTGIFPDVAEGEYLRVKGEKVVHPRYGEQLKADSCEFVRPSEKNAIEKYLASGAVKGIGEALAKRIVRKFGDDTLRIIEEEPERLSEVKGISKSKAVSIAAELAEKRDLRQAMLFLQDYGISQNLAIKIYKKYGDKLYKILRQNPYQLADDIDGVGFKRADEIAQKIGIEADSDFRIRSAVLYLLQQGEGEGNTCLPQELVESQVFQLLQIPERDLEPLLMNLVIDRKIAIKEDGGQKMVYSWRAYKAENSVAQMLLSLSVVSSVPEEEIARRLAKIEKEEQIVLDEKQREAVNAAVRGGITIVTGGPGTGKTTIIRTLIRYFETEKKTVLCAAPTGRAAKRMTEAAGREARTIHRMLEASGDPDTDRTVFNRNEDNPLEADVVIIDEMSMVDIYLMQALLRAMVPGMKLILTGDSSQLPSVGPGNVLRDMIASGCFRVVRLEKIFRQAAGSDIIVNAHRINAGEMVGPRPGSRDFLFIERDNPGQIKGAVITLLTRKLPDYLDTDWSEIQVLTPMRKGALGLEQLNLTLQGNINGPDLSKMEMTVGSTVFREGDKVMQTKNDYQKPWKILDSFRTAVHEGQGVYNGDMGVIREISPEEGQITVEFDEGRRAVYSGREAEDLELAYAITIHKSQGSEFPAVILPLLTGPRMLMNRNLLYTAVTRAKKCVCIVGSVQTFQSMIRNDVEQRRYSGLVSRLRDNNGLFE